MDKNTNRKVFHEEYPIDITNMSESEIAEAVMIFRKLKGMSPITPEKTAPKIAAKTKGKKAKNDKNSPRSRKRK